MRYFFWFIFVFSFIFSFAQKKNNIEKIKTKFSIAPFYEKEFSYLSIHNRDKDIPDILYYPNVSATVGALFSYKFIELALSFKLPESTEYNNTKMFKIDFNFIGNKLSLNMGFVHYKGMYLSNYKDFDNAVLSAPNMSLTQMFLEGQFIFSKRFSYKAAFKQTERQKTSAGSMLILVNNTFTGLSNDVSFMPLSEKNNYSDSYEINTIKSNTINMTLGYAYTFVISKYFSISSVLSGGKGLNFKWYFLGNTPRFGIRLPWYFYSKSVIGYNGKRFFCNISYTYDYNNIRFSEVDFNIIRNSLMFSLAYRFIEK